MMKFPHLVRQWSTISPIVVLAFALLPFPTPRAAAQTLANGSFEMPNLGPAGRQYNPTGAGWTFTGQCGIANNGSAWGAPTAPNGAQVAYLQSSTGNPNGRISQTVNFPAGTYAITLQASLRYLDSIAFQVLIDGDVIESATPVLSKFTPYTTDAFTVLAGNHTIEIVAVGTPVNDAIFIDDVRIISASTLANGSFETPALGTANRVIRPTNATWTFSGNSGIASNGSGWGAPPAPGGTQVALLQATDQPADSNGTIKQSCYFSGGTYNLSFQAAIRNNYQGPISLSVRVDGEEVYSTIPPIDSFASYKTPPFHVTQGVHAIEFGVVGTPVNSTIFVDAVTLNSTPMIYLGDDAAEGANVSNGSTQDTSPNPVTYAFATPGATYTNYTDAMQLIYLSDVNFYVGTVAGTLRPFAATYNGNQTSTSIKTGSNYRVVALGDVINVSANSGRQNKHFLVGGHRTSISLAPGETLAVGYLSSSGGVVRNDGTSTGTIDYVTIANTLPSSVPNYLTDDANQTLDRTLKFNVGIQIKSGPFRVSCVGDSITYGAGTTDRVTKSYPSWLQALLGSNYYVGNFGRNGATMLKNTGRPYWNETLFTCSKEYAPDIVVIMLGTNDSKVENWTTENQSQYLPNYTEMINIYKALPSHPKIIVNTSPSMVPGANGYNLSVLNNQIVPLARQAAANTGCSINEVNLGTANIPLDFPDKIHPNDAGALVIANIVHTGLLGPKTIVSGGTYKIVGKYSGLPVDVTGASTSNGAGISVSTDTGSNSQKWVLTSVGGGYYRITNVNSGKAAEANGSSGSPIFQNTYSGASSQQWQLVELGLGYYQIVNRASGYVLDVAASPGANGTVVKQYIPSSINATQQFQLIPL